MITVVKLVQKRFDHIKSKLISGPPSSQFQLDRLTFKFPVEDLRVKEQDVVVVTPRRLVKVSVVRNRVLHIRAKHRTASCASAATTKDEWFRV